MVAENHERKVKQLEAEKADLEGKFGEMTTKYNKVKAELDQTLKELEGL
jgi:tropomyosin